jgi:phosphopantothenoylcysteine decarboxylase/phosphopantothenate--cysteine ligase
MKCVVTAGPTYEELDEVRRLTNFSTGTLGCGLADYLTEKGHEVELLLGYYATCKGPAHAMSRQVFTTTADLKERLRALGSTEVMAVFHAAAVGDFGFGKIWLRTAAGEMREVTGAKVETRETGMLVELAPTPKVIRELRGWFPKGFLTGWKYELDGSREEALARGERQMRECETDACVVNGRAYGEGFGLLRRDGKLTHLTGAPELCAVLEASLPH